MPSRQPAIDKELRTMSCVNGYLAVMAEESEEIKQLMPTHLQDLMEDGEAYGWSMVLSYHATWLQHLEQGWASWGDHATKLKLSHALLWHLVAPSSNAPAAPSQLCKQPPAANRTQRKREPYGGLAKPRSKASAVFNKGQCAENTSHPAKLHVCSYCFHMV